MELANQNIRTQLLEMLSAFNALSRPLLLETQCKGYRTNWDSIATAVNSGLRGRVKQGEFGPSAFIEEIYWLKRLLIIELEFTEQDPPTIPLSHRIGMYL